MVVVLIFDIAPDFFVEFFVTADDLAAGLVSDVGFFGALGFCLGLMGILGSLAGLLVLFFTEEIDASEDGDNFGLPKIPALSA